MFRSQWVPAFAGMTLENGMDPHVIPAKAGIHAGTRKMLKNAICYYLQDKTQEHPKNIY
jgi:hypothetical protein